MRRWAVIFFRDQFMDFRSGIWRILTQPKKEWAATEIKGEEQEKGERSIHVSKRLEAAVWAKSSPCFERILGAAIWRDQSVF